MMKSMKLCLVLLLLAVAVNRSAAQNTVEGIAGEVCKEICKIDLSDTSVPPIARVTAIVKGLTPRIEHGKVIENYKKEHPDAAKLSQQDLEDRIITDIACILLRDCKNFAALAVNNGKQIPGLTKDVITYGDKINARLKEKVKTVAISQSIINECMAQVMEEHKTELMRKYGDSYIVAFQNDLKPYLFTRCEPYKRWYVGNMIKQFRMFQNLGL